MSTPERPGEGCLGSSLEEYEMEWAAAEEALVAGFDGMVDRQSATRQFGNCRLGLEINTLLYTILLKKTLSPLQPNSDVDFSQKMLAKQFM